MGKVCTISFGKLQLYTSPDLQNTGTDLQRPNCRRCWPSTRRRSSVMRPEVRTLFMASLSTSALGCGLKLGGLEETLYTHQMKPCICLVQLTVISTLKNVLSWDDTSGVMHQNDNVYTPQQHQSQPNAKLFHLWNEKRLVENPFPAKQKYCHNGSPICIQKLIAVTNLEKSAKRWAHNAYASSATMQSYSCNTKCTSLMKTVLFQNT